jgi:hypothetical protein
MPGDGMEEVMMVAALALDLAPLAHLDMALDPTGHPVQDSVKEAFQSLLVVTSKRLNGL